MSAEDLLDAIGNVRAAYIQDAGNRKKAPRWISWTAAAAACLALVISTGLFLRPKTVTYPTIPWPQSGGDHAHPASMTLSQELDLPDTADPIAVYTPVVPDLDALCAELATIHGLANEWKENDSELYISTDTCLLTVEKDTGYWKYQDRTVNLYSPEPSTLTDAQAIEIAKATAARYAVELTDLTNIQVSHGTVGSADTPIGQETVINHSVYFYPSVDGYATWGICRFIVNLDHSGQVGSVMKLYPALTLHAMEAAVSPADAFQAIQRQGGHASSPELSSADSVVFYSYEIVYYVDFDPSEQLQYCQPVYVFYGDCLDANGQVCSDGYSVMYPVLGEHRFRSR